VPQAASAAVPIKIGRPDLAALFAEIAATIRGSGSVRSSDPGDSNSNTDEARGEKGVERAAREDGHVDVTAEKRPLGLWTAGPKPFNAAAFAAARGCGVRVDAHQLAFEL
jgi:hypothetical protein